MWPVVIFGAVGCFLTKYFGAVIPESFLEKPVIKQVTLLLPISLLSAIVAVQAVVSDRHIVIDARVPGFIAAAIALKFKAQFIVVVVISAVVAAAARHFGLAN